jgi:hypothetical protein
VLARLSWLEEIAVASGSPIRAGVARHGEWPFRPNRQISKPDMQLPLKE